MENGCLYFVPGSHRPDGVRFDGTRDGRVLGERYLDSLTKGDRLQHDELNPLVHS